MKKMLVAPVALAFLGGVRTGIQTTQPPKIEFSQSTDEQERRDQPVTEEDLQILKRADQIVAVIFSRTHMSSVSTADLQAAMEQASRRDLGEFFAQWATEN